MQCKGLEQNLEDQGKELKEAHGKRGASDLKLITATAQLRVLQKTETKLATETEKHRILQKVNAETKAESLRVIVSPCHPPCKT